MGQQIGNLLINMRLNGAEFASDISRTAGRTARDTQKMRKGLDATTVSIERLRRSGHKRIIGPSFIAATRNFDSLTRRAEFLRSTMISLTAVFGGLSSALVVNAVTSMADSYTNLSNQIRTVTKSENERMIVERALYGVAQDTRTGIRDNAVLFTRLTRATDRYNISLERRLNLTRTIQKGFIAGGATSQEASSAAVQLTQGLAADQLGGEELRALKETPLGALLAEGLGVAVGDLKQMGAEGELTATRIIAAFEKVSPKIEALFAKTERSISQALTELDNAFLMYIGSQDKALGATQMVTNGLEALAENVDTVADSVIMLSAAFGTRWAAAKIGNKVTEAAVGFKNYNDVLKANVVAARAAQDSAVKLKNGYTAEVKSIQSTIAAHKLNIRNIEQEHIAYRKNIALAKEQAKVAAMQISQIRTQGRQGFGFAYGVGERDRAATDYSNSLRAIGANQTALQQSSAKLAAETAKLTQAQRSFGKSSQQASIATRGVQTSVAGLNASLAATTVRARAGAVAMRGLSSASAFFGGPVGIGLTVATGLLLLMATRSAEARQKGEEYIETLSATERRALGVASALDEAADGIKNLNTEAAKLTLTEKMLTAEADAKSYREELESTVKAFRRFAADAADSGQLGQDLLRKFKKVSSEFVRGGDNAQELSAQVSKVGQEVSDLSARAVAINELIAKFRGATTAADGAAEAIRSIGLEMSGVDISVNGPEGVFDLPSDYVEKRKDLERELASSQLVGRDADIARETSRLMKSYDLGEKLARTYAAKLVDGKKQQQEFNRTLRSGEKAAEKLSGKLEDLGQKAQVAFLEDLDRDAVSTAQSMNVAARDVQAFIDALNSGSLAAAPDVMLRIRDALTAISTEQDARKLIEDMATGVEKLKKKQEELSAVVAAHPELADKAKQAFIDYALTLDEFSWINDATSSFSDFAKSAVFDFENIGDAAKGFARRIGEIILQITVLEPLVRGLRNALGGAATGGGGFLSSIASVVAGLFHSGGDGSSPKSMRTVPAAAFIGAPKFHSGLGHDELAAIIKKSETILTDAQTSGTINTIKGLTTAAAGGGGYAPTYNVDARGAQEGVGEQIVAALKVYDRDRAPATIKTVMRRALRDDTTFR